MKALLHPDERRARITEHLRRAEFASLEDLVRQVEASVSTVRRDLLALEQSGEIRRTHGGARLAAPKVEEFAFHRRNTENVSAKDRIGATCAGLIANRQSLILDAGSTVYHVATFLEEKEPQIFTNSLAVANLFSSSGQVEVLMSGGLLYPRLGVLVGPLAERAFAEIHADVAIMGASGISEDGIYNSHALLIGMQRAMLKAARKVIFCLDHTKFGKKSMARLCGLDEIHVVVTDDRAPPDELEKLRAAGIEVLIAQEG
jgi:DeoR family transcriptional regulator, fructose operon transcriptional repressor